MQTEYIDCQTSLPGIPTDRIDSLYKGTDSKKESDQLYLLLNDPDDNVITDSIFSIYGWNEELSEWILLIKWHIENEPTPLMLGFVGNVESMFSFFTCLISDLSGGDSNTQFALLRGSQ